MSTNYSSFEELTHFASKYLEDRGRSKQTVIIYNWIWKKIKVHMEREQIEKCSSNTITDYLSLTYGEKPISKLTHHQKHCLRCALCLAQFTETGKMIEIIQRREVITFEGEIGLLMKQYIDYKGSMRLNQKTLQGHSWYLYQFWKHLDASGISSASLLSPLVIMKYAANLLPQAAGAKHLALSIIKNFLRYLHEKEKTKKDLSLIVPKDNYKKQPQLPSTYTKEEVHTILNSIDRSTPTGKRNYAILMLAVRLAMRASDISSLEFGHLLWSQETISFQQFKTKALVELPLPADVGDSIINYVKYARPSSIDKHVFLENAYPHNPIESKRVSKTACRAISESGVNIGARKHGSHALRHTMASLLLEQKTALPIISELLGHTNIQTSMCYLRIDTESLRQCALDVPAVPERFYTQKGGALYE
ncbi:site-specific recombinase XerD [Pedobacter sp. CG_S7]|uniref:site-specific integrase n=1 Tax=Pedobacter sp. CG_S7 TaxID=3143930 RepID=UPI0033926E1A